MATNFSTLVNGPSGNNLMIVDSMNLAFRWKHQGRTDFKEDYVRTVESLARSYDCSKVIIAADWGSSTYRKNIYPDYKQNRKDKVEQQTPEEKEAFEKFFEEYERTLKYFTRYPVLRYKGVEADDIAGYLVKSRSKYTVDHTWLVSSDKDWDCLISDNVSRFSYVTRKEVSTSQWPYDVSIENYVSWKALVGDPGDNILGVPGVGPKRASGLIEQYGSALDLYDACPISSKYKYIQSLNEHADRILLNLNLMDLLTFCDEAIGTENVSSIDSIVMEYMNATTDQ
jgi:5'-3' exonuclease